MFRTVAPALAAGFLAFVASTAALTGAEPAVDPMSQARKMFDDGNYAEAFDQFRRETLDPATATPGEALALDFGRAQDCLIRLNRVDELDTYREGVAKVHAADWRVLLAVANGYLDGPHHGYMIAGGFRRGDHRGGGKIMNAAGRDRVRALQLLRQALELVEHPNDGKVDGAGKGVLDRLASALQMRSGGEGAWRLQMLTDLETLPEYREGWGYYGGDSGSGAPVAENGDPVFYETPADWSAAKSDGERWRWTLARRTALFPDAADDELLERAAFLQSQFGVQTLANYGWPMGRDGDGADEDDEEPTGTFALHTLAETETICRLATGVKRITLPAEHNPIVLWRRIADREVAKNGPTTAWISANEQLGGEFENRRQYPPAADQWRRLIAAWPADLHIADRYRDRLQQIVGAWGRLEPTVMQPAGRGAELSYRFRNGKQVDFVAQKIDVRRLLDDVKKYLGSNPRELNWAEMNLDNIGYRLVEQGQQQYVGAEAGKWTVELKPRKNHFDRRTTIATPLSQPGAYLVTAKMADGNEQRVVLWVADTAIVKKPMAGSALYYVADAATGKPVAKANVEFFGWRQEQAPSGKMEIQTKNFAEFTDAGGLVQLPADEANRRHNWLAIATTTDGRLAYLGFAGIWSGDYQDQQYRQVKAYALTDRPVYRPKDEVQFKFWIRTAQYDSTPENDVEFAAKSFVVEIRNPKNEKVYSQTLTSDKYGGIVGSWKLPADATLGSYSLFVVNHGGGSFRVEEYKKPEFEVEIDAADEPVMLGETAKATITAKYYFGSPVAKGKLHYKVLRSTHDQQWFPPMPWDWLYGRGYWWFAERYDWYPGWSRWGCARPWPWWWWRQPAPPELVAEREVDLSADGTLTIDIDTAPAKAMHGDQDHRYEIQVEVTDESRRTITATGEVLVARRPFKVFLWADRGYYQAGDPIHLDMAARTLAGKGIKGVGTLRLLTVTYADGKPVENEVAKWDLPTDDEGRASLQIKASEPGQYRVAYEVADAANHRVEGAQMLTIRGEGFDGGDFRFNDLEIIPERREYAPGETVSLQVNVNQRDANVLVFIRPSNGVYQRPEVVAVAGKSAVVKVPVEARDMPNFFVEAVAVHHGRSHSVVREIFVPPTSRAANIEVVPSSDAYLPGQEAKVQLKVTDPDGKPTVGSLVVAIYDKSLDYIAGDAAPADIREFFWKWRREHRPVEESNLSRVEGPVAKNGEVQMQDLGVFGWSSVDELADSTDRFAANRDGRMALGRMGGFGGGMRRELALGAPMAMPASAGMELSAETKSMPGGLADASGGAAAPPGETAGVAPQIRENFADTALWVGSLETDANGLAEVRLNMPENLTAWKIGAWSMGAGGRVGQGSAEAVTRKNIIVRLQAPRFFVERDEVVLSANVHNYLDHAKTVRVRLDLEGKNLTGPEQAEQTIELAAGGEQRVDWRVTAAREGEATIRASAVTDEESDAMQMKFPVLVHGMLKQDAFSGMLRPQDATGRFAVVVPRERRPEQTRLEVRWSPTLAGAMLDAIPYLVDYPYGCTEQTLNRFLPAVLSQRTLQRMGVDLKQLQGKQVSLNAQEIGDPAKRAEGWKRYDANPVFDDAKLADVVKTSVNRLAEMQLSDGGWGWFSGWGEFSSPHTTAQVVRGLLVAQQNDVAIVPGVVERGVDWLDAYRREQLKLLDAYDRKRELGRVKDQPYKIAADNLDAYVQMVLVQAGRGDVRMRQYLYADRTKLAPYAAALYGLSLHDEVRRMLRSDVPWKPTSAGPVGNDQNSLETIEPAEMLAMVRRNLAQFVRQDDENQTAWLDLPGEAWWYWYGSEYEAHAAYLKLLVAAEPKSEVAPRLVKYLLNNRKHSTYWNSTRDTGLIVEAFADYLAATGEAKPNLKVEVLVDGKSRKSVAITPENLFSFDGTLVIEGEALEAGEHVVELRKTGEGPLYFNGYLQNFTLEDPIHATGLELKIARKFYRLIRDDRVGHAAGAHGQVVDQREVKYRREEIVNLAEVTSGDLVEVELEVDSKNDYEYILLEDRKAAGFEPVEVRSGYNGNDLGAYVEYRDQRVALFVQRLMRGKHSVSYRLRAEAPGKFSALPATAAAMYAPELKANSEELKVRVVDRKE